MSLDKEKSLELLETMIRIRRCEEKIRKDFADGKIPGFVHLSIGQEAVAAGVCFHLKKNDYIATGHRGHGHIIAKGANLKEMFAELYGKKTGLCQGKGGSMHLCSLDAGVLDTSGIVGAQMPIAVGAALYSQIKKTDQVTVVFFGDGASNLGAFHESINLASVWKLPIIFCCENNLYAQETSTRVSMNIEDIADRAKAYGIEGVIVDGMDVETVAKTSQELIERARKGEPILMECKTYRFAGHYEGDVYYEGDESYRPKEEREFFKKKDPIPNYKNTLIQRGFLTEDAYAKIEESILQEIEEAVKFAEESPWPKPEETLERVYVQYP
jgi:pyruvate dehydrogenase E1 component alpha subunit